MKLATEPPADKAEQRFGLGLDAGGTQTRWALANCHGQLQAEGAVLGLSALQLGSEAGRQALANTLADVATALQAVAGLRGVVAGVTGFGAEHSQALQALMAAAFAVPLDAVRLMSDIELACQAAFPGGDGIVVYAGTGSIAARLAADGSLQRAGGRGNVIDDAGGGHWIAREALRHIWRAEDEATGAWRQSPLAQAVFETLGGSDWALTRQWVYGATRGELGVLALAVAKAADSDPVALRILQSAGQELARLGLAMQGRCGALPLALAGRVFELHPAVEASLRAALAAAAQADRHAAEDTAVETDVGTGAGADTGTSTSTGTGAAASARPDLASNPAVRRLALHAHHTAAALAAAEGRPCD
jgi:glucosamine kinase